MSSLIQLNAMVIHQHNLMDSNQTSSDNQSLTSISDNQIDFFKNNRSSSDSNSSLCDAVFCPEYTQNEWMFRIILYFGSSISIVSVLENLLIFHSLFRHPQCFQSHFIFLLFLAIFDIIACGLYIPVIVVDQFKDRYKTEYPWLEAVWSEYFAAAMAITNVALTSSCYLILVLQLERFLMTMKLMTNLINTHNRKWFALSAFLFAVVLKMPICLEFTITESFDDSCNTTSFVVEPTELATNLYYNVIYRFWCRNLFTIFLPFILLAVFNWLIVRRLRTAQRRAKIYRLSGSGLSGIKDRARAATRTFVLIASTYLASNLLNVFITAWEHIAIDSLFGNYCNFYFVSTDIVSLLTVFGCALRLPIYLSTNMDLRKLIQSGLHSIVQFSKRRRVDDQEFSTLDNKDGNVKQQSRRRCNGQEVQCHSARLNVNTSAFDELAIHLTLCYSTSAPEGINLIENKLETLQTAKNNNIHCDDKMTSQRDDSELCVKGDENTCADIELQKLSSTPVSRQSVASNNEDNTRYSELYRNGAISSKWSWYGIVPEIEPIDL